MQGEQQQSAGRWGRNLAITAWQVLFLLLLLGRALTAPIDYDEEQYVAAGVMARHLMLYRDFIYLQPPADPLLLAGLFSVTGGYYLLTARLVSWVLAVAVFGLTAALLRRFGLGRGLSVGLATIVLLTPFLDRATATARNDILPLALFLAGLLLYFDAAHRDKPARWLAAAGLLVGLAVEAKVSYVFAPVALLLHAGWTGRLRGAVPLGAGIAVAALPGLCYLALAPGQAWYDLLEYHRTAPLLWYQRENKAEWLTPEYRLTVLVFLLGWGAGGALTLMVVGLGIARLWLGPRSPVPAMPSRGLLLLLIGLATAVGFQPSPSWPMYYAPLAPLLAALAAALFIGTRFRGPPGLVPLLLAIAAVPAMPPLWAAAADLFTPEPWPGLQVHRQATMIRERLQASGLDGAVATLFPTHVLDTNPVPSEFASGPFFFRTADPIPPARVAQLRGASTETLEDQFDRDPPAAILGGLAAGQWSVEMDASLEAYARRHQYQPVVLDPALWPKGSWLYLRER